MANPPSHLQKHICSTCLRVSLQVAILTIDTFFQTRIFSVFSLFSSHMNTAGIPHDSNGLCPLALVRGYSVVMRLRHKGPHPSTIALQTPIMLYSIFLLQRTTRKTYLHYWSIICWKDCDMNDIFVIIGLYIILQMCIWWIIVASVTNH